MKLNIDLGAQSVSELEFFADAVVWSGEATAQEIQGRMTLEGMTPDPGGARVELKRLSVMDECARASCARVEFGPDGAARILGRLELPLEAEFQDGCGNAYFCGGAAAYDLSLDADGLARPNCGEVVLRCEATELTVQATSCECIAYLMKLDVRAYIVRRELIGLKLEEDAQPVKPCRPCRPPCRPCPPRPRPEPRAQDAAAQGEAHVGCALNSLAAGAARSCGARPAAQGAQARSEADEDEYRTIVKLPSRRRRGGRC